MVGCSAVTAEAIFFPVNLVFNKNVFEFGGVKWQGNATG